MQHRIYSANIRTPRLSPATSARLWAQVTALMWPWDTESQACPGVTYPEGFTWGDRGRVRWPHVFACLRDMCVFMCPQFGIGRQLEGPCFNPSFKMVQRAVLQLGKGKGGAFKDTPRLKSWHLAVESKFRRQEKRKSTVEGAKSAEWMELVHDHSIFIDYIENWLWTKQKLAWK